MFSRLPLAAAIRSLALRPADNGVTVPLADMETQQVPAGDEAYMRLTKIGLFNVKVTDADLAHEELY